jgi:hypothetical protein
MAAAVELVATAPETVVLVVAVATCPSKRQG